MKLIRCCLFSLVCLSAVGAGDLKTYQETYVKNSEQILQSYQPQFSTLQQHYQKSLEALKAQAQSSGDLKKTKAAIAEIERFQKAKSLPATVDEAEIPEIKVLQSAYVKQFADFERDMTARLGTLSAKYEQALDMLQRELVKAGKLEEATAVQAEKSNLQKAADDTGGIKVPAEVSPKQSVASNWSALNEQDAAQAKTKWTKALGQARRNFLASNDLASAEFVSRMLAALEEPGGLSAAVLATNSERLKQFTRELIRRGALESAVILKTAHYSLVQNESADVPDGPIRPKRQNMGDAPGPGGLILYMPFDASPVNGVVRDESGVGNHGRVDGAQWVADGHMGGAYRFNITNVDDRIVIPDSDSLGVQYVTLAAWIKTSDSDGFWNRILDKDSRKGYSLALGGQAAGNKLWGMVQLCITFRTGAFSNRRVGDGRWHHVAGTYDGKTSKLYVDGGEVKEERAQNPGPIPRNHWDLCIGNSVVEYEGGAFCSFDGLIDEVRVYNRALSAEEIKALANATKAGTGGTATPLTAAERIKQAKQLLDQGLINKEDYDKKVQKIVDSL